MDLVDFRAVVAVAEERHFGRAAVRLRIAQPALSRRIRAVEREVGVPLFHRTTRSVHVTAAGDGFVAAARDALTEAAGVAARARRAARGEVGLLTIAFSGSAAAGPLPALLRRYREHRPEVRLVLHELFDDAALSTGVASGSFDAAFQRLPAANPRLTATVLDETPMVVVLPADHRLAVGSGDVPGGDHPDLAITDLSTEPLLLWPAEVSGPSRDEVLAAFATAGVVPRVAQEVRSPQALLGLVAGGMGVGILAGWYRSVQRRGTVYRPLRGWSSRLHVVTRVGDPSPLVADLLAHAVVPMPPSGERADRGLPDIHADRDGAVG